MLTPRQSYDNCDALLGSLNPNRSLIDQTVFYERAKYAGIVDLRAAAGSTLKASRFQTPTWEFMQQLKLQGATAQAASDRLDLLSQTLRLPGLTHRDNNLFLSGLATTLDWTLGAAARVAAPVNQMRNFAASQLEMHSRMFAYNASNRLNNRLRQVNKSLNLGWTSQDIAEAQSWLIEVGSLDRRMAELSPTMVIQADAHAKLNVLTTYMLNQGIPSDVLDELIQYGTDVTYSFDSITRMARALGVQLDTMQGLGWLHREYTLPMLKFLKELSPDTLIQSAADAGHITLNSLLQTARRTNLFLVQDKVALAQILGLTPADHIFVPQTSKVVTITPKPVTSIKSATIESVTQVEFSQLVHNNPNVRVQQTPFTSWADLKAAVLKQTGALPQNWNRNLLNAYTTADYLTYSKNGKVYLVHTPRARILNGHYTYQWGAGRATDLTSFTYINGNYTAPVIRSSESTVEVLAAEAGKAIGTSDQAALAALNSYARMGDEAGVLSYAERFLPHDGIVIQDTNSGGYVAFNLKGKPDFFVNDAMHQVDALFDPAFAYGLLDLLRDVTGGNHNTLMDTLVDTGVLAKVPMSSGEFFEYFVDKYRLPFNRPSEVINMNLREVFSSAANKMKQAMGASLVMTKILSDDGIQAGWLVPADVYRANRSMYADYVKIGENQALVQTMDAVGLDGRIREFENAYMNPTVARMLEATIKVGSSPTAMAKIGSVMVNSLKVFSKLLLTTIGAAKYILNQTIDPLVNSVANGGDITEVPVRMRDLWLFLSNNNLDHIDATTTRYLHPDWQELQAAGKPYQLTQRDATKLWLDNHLHGFASGTTDIAMGDLGNPITALVDEASLAWHLVKWATYDASWSKIGRTFLRLEEAVAETGAEAVNKLFSTQGFLATYMDKSIQLNHFLSQLHPIANADVRAVRSKVASLGFFSHWAEDSTDLWNRMDRTFINPYNAGTITKALNRIGSPMFAVYVLKTPFNVMRQVASRPVQFYNFMRMWSIMEAAEEHRTGQADIEFTDYQQHAHVLGEWTAPNGNRERMLLYDTANNFFNTLDAFKDLGSRVRNDYTIHRVDDIAGLGESMGEEIMRKWAASSQPLIKAAYSLATSKNPRTGMTYDDELLGMRPSFLFWQTDPVLRDTLYELIPFSRSIDNWNPAGVLGTAPVLDEFGNVIIDGKLGWNNVQRYPLRNADRIKLSDPRGYNFMYRALVYSGFAATITDADANMQSNLRKLDSTIIQLESQFNEFAQEVTMVQHTVNPEEQARRLQQGQEMVSLIMLYKLEQLKWQHYLNHYKGTLTPAQINEANEMIYEQLRTTGRHPLVDQYHNIMRVHTEQFLEFQEMVKNGEG